MRPYIFIGSSTAGLRVAGAVASNLKNVGECEIWDKGLFGLSEGTLISLIKKLSEFDFAIFVLTNDGVTITRDKEHNAPVDNVLLEIGMFIGRIGIAKTFIIIDKSANIKIPTDLAGITVATYEPPVKATLKAALTDACIQIEEAINNLAIGNFGKKFQITATAGGSLNSGYFIKLDETHWFEFDGNGVKRYDFTLKNYTSNEVLLYDKSRDLHIKLTEEECFGEDKNKKMNKIYNGKWIKM